MSENNPKAGSIAHIKGVTAGVIAMGAVVVVSNILVQYPVEVVLPTASGGVDLKNLLTWGAFSYPFAFLVTDLTNRCLGSFWARRVVWVGFILAVILSVWLATPRLAVASGSAFLLAQMLDVAIFDRLRRMSWWKAPLISSLIASVLDTVIFFSLAYSPAFDFIGFNVVGAAIERAPFMGLFDFYAERWVSWGFGDFLVKVLLGALLLFPYRLFFLAVFAKPRQAT